MKRINREWAAAGSCHLADGDAVAEVLELGDVVVAPPVGVAPAGELVTSAVVGQQVPAGDQDRVPDGDRRFLLAGVVAAGRPPSTQLQ